MYVASSLASSWWSSLDRSAWYTYRREGAAEIRTCATQVWSFFRRLLTTIGRLPADATQARGWTTADTNALALALIAAGERPDTITWHDSPVWNREMLRDAIWLLNHRGEIAREAIILPAETVLPRMNVDPPRDSSSAGAVGSPQCADGSPVSQPSAVVPGVSAAAIATAISVFGSSAIFAIARWYSVNRGRRRR